MPKLVKQTNDWRDELARASSKIVGDQLALLTSQLNGKVANDAAIRQMVLDDAARSTKSEAAGNDIVGIVRPGDMWILGRHRMLCGDSRIEESYQILFKGERACMIYTDPPYNVNFGGNNYNPKAKGGKFEGLQWVKIAGDNFKSGEDFISFISLIFGLAVKFSEPASPTYVWSAPMEDGYRTLIGLKEAGLHIQSQIIWVKNVFALGQADYQWKHEPIWYGRTSGSNHFWAGGRDKSTVWQYDRDANASYEHPTQKPVELAREAVRNSCRPGGIVLDMFVGSGSTIIACEMEHVTCYGIELDPKYVEVSIRRWARWTGQEPVRDSDGTRLSEL